jgi:hypothetical protein
MRKYQRGQADTGGLALIAIAIVLFGWLTAGGLKSIKRASDMISVTGSAKRAIGSDLIVWRASYSSQRPALKDAYEDVEQNQKLVRDYLKRNAVPEPEVKFNAVSTGEVQEYTNSGMPSGRITGYTCTQTFEVRSARVKEVADLANRAPELIKDGINLNSWAPEYLYTKLADLRIEMLGEATADARQRAERIAESAGCKIGALRSARMGVFQVTARNSTDVSDYGYYDTSSLDKDITSVVTLSFAVE